MEEAVFWAAAQGIGTIIAAVAAIIALVIAGSQLRQLIASNRILADSNDTMAASNIALTRPYVVVDLEFRPSVTRAGGTNGTTVFIVIRNDGRTPAHNITMTVDRPFAAVSVVDQEGWRKSLEDLNRMMDGVSVLRSLTSTRPLKYVLDKQGIFGSADEPAPRWEVRVSYEDANGRTFQEVFHLEVEPWRRSVAIPDPLIQAGKYVDAVAHELKDLRSTIRSKDMSVTVSPAPVVHSGGRSRDARRVHRLAGGGEG